MIMDIDAAKRAGELASAIESRQAKMAELQSCIDDGWIITDTLARSPDGNRTIRLQLAALDAQTNGMALGFILQIYQGQLAALEADLATAETWVPPVEDEPPVEDPPPPVEE